MRCSDETSWIQGANIPAARRSIFLPLDDLLGLHWRVQAQTLWPKSHPPLYSTVVPLAQKHTVVADRDFSVELSSTLNTAKTAGDL